MKYVNADKISPFLLLFLLGCGASETEKQRIALETVRLQTEQLQELRKQQGTLAEKERQLAELEKQLKQKWSHTDAELSARETNAQEREAQLKAEEERIKTLVKQDEAILAKTRDAEAKLDFRAQLAGKRIPFLEQLALETSEALAQAHNQLLEKAEESARKLSEPEIKELEELKQSFSPSGMTYEAYKKLCDQLDRIRRIDYEFYGRPFPEAVERERLGLPVLSREETEKFFKIRGMEEGPFAIGSRDANVIARIMASGFHIDQTHWHALSPEECKTLYDTCLKALYDSDVVVIESQDEFKTQAIAVMERLKERAQEHGEL